jgi:glycine cleavage system protein P-like pyridoxal-binding family
MLCSAGGEFHRKAQRINRAIMAEPHGTADLRKMILILELMANSANLRTNPATCGVYDRTIENTQV